MLPDFSGFRLLNDQVILKARGKIPDVVYGRPLPRRSIGSWTWRLSWGLNGITIYKSNDSSPHRGEIMPCVRLFEVIKTAPDVKDVKVGDVVMAESDFIDFVKYKNTGAGSLFGKMNEKDIFAIVEK